MKKGVLRDKKREERIDMEIVVDAYDREERIMGWCVYLEDVLEFPFNARCISQRPISPLKKGEEVDVIEMAPEDECESEMFVTVKWDKGKLAVPLIQLEPINAKAGTREAIGDWHYWVQKGYEF